MPCMDGARGASGIRRCLDGRVRACIRPIVAACPVTTPSRRRQAPPERAMTFMSANLTRQDAAEFLALAGHLDSICRPWDSSALLKERSVMFQRLCVNVHLRSLALF